MGRKKPEEIAEKVKNIKKVLAQHKEGIWLHELARECNYSVGSVWYLLKYVENVEVIKEIPRTRENGSKIPYLKLIKLKSEKEIKE
jgi:predicted transcriptional regulator